MDVAAPVPASSYRLYAACVGVVTFFLPCIALIASVFLIDGFVASDRLMGWSLATTPIAVLLNLSAFGPIFYRVLASSVRQRREVIANGALLMFSPIFVALLWHFFVTESLAYLLHLADHPSAKTQLEQVLYADRGTRTCRNMVKLSGDSFLLPRKLCGLSQEAVEKLRTGGKVELEGRGSSYGFQVQRYRYDVAG